MELPPLLRSAVEHALSGVALADLATTAAALSRRYREERRDGAFHVASRRDALAYLAVRLPATYAAAEKTMGLESLVALVAATGSFSMTCMTANTFGIEPPADAPTPLAG